MAENHFKNTKILCMTLLCEQDPWFSIISNTTSLASKYNWAKQIGLCADHLTEGGKIYAHMKEEASFGSSQRLSRGKATVIPSIGASFWEHARLHANSFARNTAHLEGVDGVFKVGSGRNKSFINWSRQIWDLHNLEMDWNFNW